MLARVVAAAAGVPVIKIESTATLWWQVVLPQVCLLIAAAVAAWAALRSARKNREADLCERRADREQDGKQRDADRTQEREQRQADRDNDRSLALVQRRTDAVADYASSVVDALQWITNYERRKALNGIGSDAPTSHDLAREGVRRIEGVRPHIVLIRLLFGAKSQTAVSAAHVVEPLFVAQEAGVQWLDADDYNRDVDDSSSRQQLGDAVAAFVSRRADAFRAFDDFQAAALEALQR